MGVTAPRIELSSGPAARACGQARDDLARICGPLDVPVIEVDVDAAAAAGRGDLRVPNTATGSPSSCSTVTSTAIGMWTSHACATICVRLPVRKDVDEPRLRDDLRSATGA